MDKAHRANKQSRDIVCCKHDFTLKEQIMARARAQREIIYAGTSIQLYPDLSWITLEKRRHLKPLLLLLKDALVASIHGCSEVLRTYEDLSAFSTKLDIPSPNLIDWDLENPSTPPSRMASGQVV